MKALGIVGFLLLLAFIPLAQVCISNFNQYADGQRQVDQKAIDCANTACFGQGLTAGEVKGHFDTSMRCLMMALLVGPVGAVFMGLNWKEMIDK